MSVTEVQVAPATARQMLESLAHRRRGRAPRGTHRIAAVCEALDAPQVGLEAVQVVGTDGKTSIVRIMASLLRSLGVAVGETTSPHLEDVTDRIRVGGAPITTRQVVARWEDLQAAIAAAERRTDESVTFFEAVTALALRTFADEQVDVALVEAGIGGVLDATNVAHSRVAVVSHVGFDHPELGDDLADVAREKAGVVAPGGLLLSAHQAAEAATTIDRVVAERDATLLRAGRDFGVAGRRTRPEGQQVELRGLGGSKIDGFLALHGRHQADNAIMAVAAVQSVLGTTDLDPDALRRGLAQVRIPGRLERRARRRMADVLLDGAHDVDALRALVELLVEVAPAGRLTVIFGLGSGRDPNPLIDELQPLDADLIVTGAASPHAMASDALARCLRGRGLSFTIAPTVSRALSMATARTPADGLIVVTGSLHLVGEARGMMP